MFILHLETEMIENQSLDTLIQFRKRFQLTFSLKLD